MPAPLQKPFTGAFSNNVTLIYNILKASGLNTAAACGILANMEKESGFNPKNLQDSYNQSLGYSDTVYTVSVDRGSYKNFVHDSAGYGLVQWTHRDLKRGLYNYAKSMKVSIGDLNMQVNYLVKELKTNYTSVWNKLKSVDNTDLGAYNAAYIFCYEYEKPASKEIKAKERGTLARHTYWPYYSKDASGDSSSGNSSDGISSLPVNRTPVEYKPLTSYDMYSEKVSSNLTKIAKSNYEYGHLIDLTHGGEFKFYIPEFSETAGSNYTDISIAGRSVSIKAYNNTNSRVVNISLELFAGAGLYNTPNAKDTVGKLHEDVRFVKSLEYPDYSNPIVRPPSVVQLILGSAFQMVGIVTAVNVEHKKPADSKNRSMYIKLNFTVTQIASDPPSYSEIRKG